MGRTRCFVVGVGEEEEMRVPNFIDSDDSTIIFWCVLCRQSRHLSGNACKMQERAEGGAGGVSHR